MTRILLLPLLMVALLLPITHAIASTQTPLARQSNEDSHFRHGKTIHFPNGLVMTLSSYQPVSGLNWYPRGPRYLPRKGDKFVLTWWLIRNTTHHGMRLSTWMARSRDMNSTAFIQGNAPNRGTIFAGETFSQGWYFEVAKVGKVAIFYDHFADHWLPRGREPGPLI
jgi:hypothetical protein